MTGCTLGEALQNVDEPGRMSHEANEWQAAGQDYGSPECIFCMVRGRRRLSPTITGVLSVFYGLAARPVRMLCTANAS